LAGKDHDTAAKIIAIASVPGTILPPAPSNSKHLHVEDRLVELDDADDQLALAIANHELQNALPVADAALAASLLQASQQFEEWKSSSLLHHLTPHTKEVLAGNWVVESERSFDLFSSALGAASVDPVIDRISLVEHVQHLDGDTTSVTISWLHVDEYLPQLTLKGRQLTVSSTGIVDDRPKKFMKDFSEDYVAGRIRFILGSTGAKKHKAPKKVPKGDVDMRTQLSDGLVRIKRMLECAHTSSTPSDHLTLGITNPYLQEQTSTLDLDECCLACGKIYIPKTSQSASSSWDVSVVDATSNFEVARQCCLCQIYWHDSCCRQLTIDCVLDESNVEVSTRHYEVGRSLNFLWYGCPSVWAKCSD